MIMMFAGLRDSASKSEARGDTRSLATGSPDSVYGALDSTM